MISGFALRGWVVVVSLPLVVLIALVFPIPFFLAYLIVAIGTRNFKKNGIWRVIKYAATANAAIGMAFLLSQRNYYSGDEVGFGSDMLHYAAAFELIASQDWGWGGFKEVMEGVIFLTGGGEPMFWIVIVVISFFTDDPIHMHVAVSLVGFFLIFLSAELYNKTGAFVLALYFSTITCYAFQGSALRSGLALGVLMLAIGFLARSKRISAIFMSVIAALTHFSMAPFFLAFVSNKMLALDKQSVVRTLAILFALASSIYLLTEVASLEVLQRKLDARMSEDSGDITSGYQFLVEAAVMSVVCWRFSNRLSAITKHLFVIFVVIDLGFLLVFPSIFPRSYRYIYTVYLFIFAELVDTAKRSVIMVVLVGGTLWNIYIVSTRYQGLFVGENFLQHFIAPWI
ncbi:MAG: EpsG family protein [Candidatus Accumulibacter sp.]|uniref:EpsG family protein n=1 Tax=Accumulibacter sp. TaxID=2053492 RepID=UPI001B0A1FF2|nr:EpsG family protein [Accumulibacter sp.]MBO3701647.1 EpsG family protein [Accumulibacter sp.]